MNKIEKILPEDENSGGIQKLSFEKLSWAAFISRLLGESGPDAYLTVFKDIRFREALAREPSSIDPEELRAKLIAGFLNKWRSRFPNNPHAALAIIKAIQAVQPLIQALQPFTIVDIDFDSFLIINGNKITASNATANIFSTVCRCHGFRSTAGAKILGVINPSLFVMWDDSILYHYLSAFSGAYDGSGYVAFLGKMQKAAHFCLKDFELQQHDCDLEHYLSDKLNVHPKLPIAKYLDEYNWITITKGISLPPKWHPLT